MTCKDADPGLAPPQEAMAALRARLEPVGAEAVPLTEAVGRVLAEPVTSDRPSPACDVSAMDGYALRSEDARPGRLSVAGEVATGYAPPPLPPGEAMRVFTGGAIPAGAELVVKREDVTEWPDAIELGRSEPKPGSNIRRRGENSAAGVTVLEAGELITAAVAAALANFGVTTPAVFRRVRVAVIITGDELLPPEATPEPWQLRDSNAEALRSLLAPLPWVELGPVQRVADELEHLTRVVASALADCDALILTGGVSMGDHDHVPDAVRGAGGEVVFHKLAVRPGKPILGAVGPERQAILGLPGNPVSVLIGARRLGAVLLRHRAGWGEPDTATGAVEIVNPASRRLGLWWYPLVRLTGPGEAELVSTKGSGDLVSSARSDGFIELPPDEGGPGPWPFYPWAL